MKLLEKQIKNLYDLYMSRGSTATHDNEDDAMFTKKPLGGMSCASCQKDVINMNGRKVTFHPWNRMPYRDPSERIARVLSIAFILIGGSRFLQDAIYDKPRDSL